MPEQPSGARSVDSQSARPDIGAAEALLARFPRLAIAGPSTPLEPAEHFSAWLGGPSVWMKRDDLTRLGGGGNKNRKLDFLIGQAVQHEADCVLTGGGVQSNHVRQTAAAAARYDLACHVLLEEPAVEMSPEFYRSGNLFLDRLVGAN